MRRFVLIITGLLPPLDRCLWLDDFSSPKITLDWVVRGFEVSIISILVEKVR